MTLTPVAERFAGVYHKCPNSKTHCYERAAPTFYMPHMPEHGKHTREAL